MPFLAVRPGQVLTDGPYGGGVCSATNHSHHHGAQDSVYQQYRLQADFYRKLFSEGKFIRQPDTYYFDGGQHSPLGYSEQQYSLPRWIDLTVSRQGLLDDVWLKPAVMGWMFLPMKPYHAGGDGASFEPYVEHLKSYEFALSQYLGSGCGMTYRGDRLYDTKGDASYQMVKAKVRTKALSSAVLPLELCLRQCLSLPSVCPCKGCLVQGPPPDLDLGHRAGTASNGPLLAQRNRKERQRNRRKGSDHCL
eukprot:SAG22_NODE_142_length_17922_cov_10.990406_10_plen_249_part_00